MQFFQAENFSPDKYAHSLSFLSHGCSHILRQSALNKAHSFAGNNVVGLTVKRVEKRVEGIAHIKKRKPWLPFFVMVLKSKY